MAQPAPTTAPPPEPDPPRSHTSPRGKRNTWRVVARWLKRGFLIAVAVAVVAMIVVAWLPKPTPVDVAEVVRGPMQVTVDEDGRARVKDRYTVSAPISGRVARIELDAGDSVEQGVVVARIVPLDPPLLDERSREGAKARVAAASAASRQTRAQIERAEAALRFAEEEEAKMRKLVASGALPPRDLDRAELEARAAAAELESLKFGAQVAAHEVRMAQAALGRLTPGATAPGEQFEVPAPVSGRILEVIQESEGVVQAGAPLLEIGDPSALEIVADVLTRDAVDIRPGARAIVDRWGGPPLDARVRLVEPSAFTRVSALGVEEQRVNVVMDLDTPRERWESLGDGYRVETHTVVWSSEDAVQVPTSAAFRHGDGWAVYTAQDGVARLTPVEIGRRTGQRVQITAGLEPPARVIVHPSDRIADGVQVAPRN